jgi:hypothetical protein
LEIHRIISAVFYLGSSNKSHLGGGRQIQPVDGKSQVSGNIHVAIFGKHIWYGYYTKCHQTAISKGDIGTHSSKSEEVSHGYIRERAVKTRS